MHLRENAPAHSSFQAQKSEITGMCTRLVTIWNVPLEYYTTLVGGIPTPLKNMKVSWDDYSQYLEKSKMFQTTNQLYYYIV
jgi:hypothetical protein